MLRLGCISRKNIELRVKSHNTVVFYSFPGVLVLISLVIVSYYANLATGQFCYDDPACGPDTWAFSDPLCGNGGFQSPINLEYSKATYHKIGKSVKLVLNKEYGKAHSFYLKNNGKSSYLSFFPNETSPCLIKGNGFLPEEPYYFASLHFHWGPDDYSGSEHHINGKAFPLEMHMIHRQQSDTDKKAVFSVLFKLSKKDNPQLTPIINNLAYASSTEYAAVPAVLNLTSLLPKRVKVFRYVGSLTTPPCTQGVIWTVFDDHLTVSTQQLMAFRQLLGSDGRPIRTNFRPVQPAFTHQRKKVFYMKSINLAYIIWTYG